MCEREVASLDTLGLTLGTTGEAQSRTRVGSNENAGILLPKRDLRLENVSIVYQASLEAAVVLKGKGWDIRPDFQVLGDEVCDRLHGLAKLLVCSLDADQELGPCDFQQDVLAVWGVLGVNNTDNGTGLESPQVRNHEVNTSVSVDGNHISDLTSMSQEVVSQLIRALMDLAVSECSLRVTSSLGLDNTLSVGELVCILSKDVMDSSTKVTPVKVDCRVGLEVGGRHFYVDCAGHKGESKRVCEFRL